jgi:hypothetical protein
MMRAPMSRMDILTDTELKKLIQSSQLYYKYNEPIDRDSAFEILNRKIQKINEKEEVEKKLEKAKNDNSYRRTRKKESSFLKPILKVVTSATFIRGVLGVLKRAM